MNRTFCLALDLKNNPELIQTYKEHHAAGNVWPQVISSIREAGIEDMKIYLTGNRLYMHMEVNESFDFDAKAKADAENPMVQKWETLMWKFQQALPWAAEGEKWVLMEEIFDLSKQ